jgi:hypothetical protein
MHACHFAPFVVIRVSVQYQANVHATHAIMQSRVLWIHSQGQCSLTRFRVVWRGRLGSGPPAVVGPLHGTRALDMLGIRRLHLLAKFLT